MEEREASSGAHAWVMGSVTETGYRGLLLISLCDLGQDKAPSGSSDSQTPGHSSSTWEQWL